MQDLRPRFLNLTQIKFPITAIVSIAQRVSGVFLFIALPVILCYLQQSLTSQTSFNEVVASIGNNIWLQLGIWLYALALVFHTLGGIRHLIMDIGFLEELCIAKLTSYLTFALTLVLMLIAYLWIY